MQAPSGSGLDATEGRAQMTHVIPLTKEPWVPTVTRLTTKHQTTIPLEVRRALDLEAGDHVEFSVEDGRVTLRKVELRPSEDLAFRLIQTHAMRDWDTPEDDEAFRDL